MRKPERTLAGRPGARWAFFEGLDVGSEGDPYLDRLRLIQTPLFGIYLHHIHREDRDRDVHDHPWWFASLILAGSYSELVRPDKTDASVMRHRERHRWSLRVTPRQSAHRITAVEGPLWTLVLTGPRRSDWGFWPQGRFVQWQQYLGGADGQ